MLYTQRNCLIHIHFIAAFEKPEPLFKIHDRFIDIIMHILSSPIDFRCLVTSESQLHRAPILSFNHPPCLFLTTPDVGELNIP